MIDWEVVEGTAVLTSSAISLLAFITSIRTLRSGRKAIREQVRSEQLSRHLAANNYCQARFQELEMRRLQSKERLGEGNDQDGKNDEDRNKEIESFCRAYWSMKADQFDYWLSGFVDHVTFKSWVHSTARHFRNRDNNFFGVTFMVAWVHYGRRYHLYQNPMFVRFHDALEKAFCETKDQEDDSIVILKLLSELESLNLSDEKNVNRINKIRKYGSPDSIDDLLRDYEAQKDKYNAVNQLYNDYLRGYDIFEYQGKLEERLKGKGKKHAPLAEESAKPSVTTESHSPRNQVNGISANT